MKLFQINQTIMVLNDANCINRCISRSLICMLLLIFTTVIPAQEAALNPTIGEAISTDKPVDSAAAIETAAPTGKWRFGTSFAGFVGVKTSFTGLGTFQSAFAPAALGGGTNYNYDDGFVRLDATGNAGGLTWNWGYNNASQFNPAGTGSISSSISNSAANGAIEDSSGGAGFEFMAYYEMGEVPWSAEGKKRPVWGMRSAFQYARLGGNSRQDANGDVIRTTDSFDLGGIIPPAGPYAGTFAGPGPVIADAPTRTTQVIAGGANVAGYRQFDTDLFSLNFGPYMEFQVQEKLSFGVEAGLALAIASGTYRHESTTTIAGVGTQTTSGNGSRTAFLPGGYLGVNATVEVNEKWSIYGAARYQYMKDFEVSAGGSQAQLSFGSAFVLSAGAIFRF